MSFRMKPNDFSESFKKNIWVNQNSQSLFYALILMFLPFYFKQNPKLHVTLKSECMRKAPNEGTLTPSTVCRLCKTLAPKIYRNTWQWTMYYFRSTMRFWRHIFSCICCMTIHESNLIFSSCLSPKLIGNFNVCCLPIKLVTFIQASYPWICTFTPGSGWIFFLPPISLKHHRIQASATAPLQRLMHFATNAKPVTISCFRACHNNFAPAIITTISLVHYYII